EVVRRLEVARSQYGRLGEDARAVARAGAPDGRLGLPGPDRTLGHVDQDDTGVGDGVAADHHGRRGTDHGEVAMTAGDPPDGDAGRRGQHREADRAEDLVGRQAGGEITLEEVVDGDGPLAPVAAAGN